MADSNELKEDTVRIELPPLPGSKPPGPDPKSRETVRIQLGPRQPSDKSPLRTTTESPPVSNTVGEVLLPPDVFPAQSALPHLSTEPSSAAPSPAPAFPGAPSSSPKKETARILRIPDPLSKAVPTVQMKKTQPLIAMPHATPKRASIAVAPTENSITPLCWALLGVSVTILIIQIWTYFS